GVEFINYSGNEGVRFILKGFDRLAYEFQPDTLFETGVTILSLKPGYEYFNGEEYLEIIGVREKDSVKKSLKVNVFGDNFQPGFNREKKYVAEAIDFIKDEYPEFIYQLEKIDTCRVFCYHPFPAFDIVNHSVMLYGEWRISIQEHVMVPPYNWKKIYLWNVDNNLYFGVKIDTDGELCLIPCQLKYYYHETNFLPIEILLNNNTIQEDNEINELTGLFSTVDNFDTLSYHYEIVNRNVPFSIENGNELRAGTVLKYEEDSLYSIDVLSRNELGCGITNRFDIYVIPKSTPVGMFNAKSDSFKFLIRGNKLSFNRSFDLIEVYDLTGKVLRTACMGNEIHLQGFEKQILIIRALGSDTFYSIKLIL
ncbi:MAG: hypothetical protein ACP5E3_18410, partial [Bacteroidales bacterium]